MKRMDSGANRWLLIGWIILSQELEEKTRYETADVDDLRAKVEEMLANGQQLQAANQAKEIVDKFDEHCRRLKVISAYGIAGEGFWCVYFVVQYI